MIKLRDLRRGRRWAVAAQFPCDADLIPLNGRFYTEAAAERRRLVLRELSSYQTARLKVVQVPRRIRPRRGFNLQLGVL